MLKCIHARVSAAPLLLLGLLLLCAAPSTAQESDAPSADGSTVERATGGQPFGAYGDVCDEDEQARLDYFSIELQKHPESKGYLLFYHGVNELPARITDYRPDRALDYLVNSRGVDAARLSIIRGGFRAEMTTELWVVPEGSPAPEPTETVEYIKPTGRTYQYNEEWLNDEYIIPFRASAEESVGDEGEAEADADATPAPDAAEPDVEAGDQSLPKNETPESIADMHLSWVSERFAEAIRHEDDARACIIYYADGEQTDLSKMQAIIESGRNILVEKYGLRADHTVIIYGGYREYPTIATWIVPANCSLPAPTPAQKPAAEPETNAQ